MERPVPEVKHQPQGGKGYGSNSSAVRVNASQQSTIEHMSDSRIDSIVCQQPTFEMRHRGQQEQSASQHWKLKYSSVRDDAVYPVDIRGIQMSSDVLCAGSSAMRQASYSSDALQQQTYQANQRQSFVNQTNHLYMTASQNPFSATTVTYASQVAYQGTGRCQIIDPKVLSYPNTGCSALPVNDQKTFGTSQCESSNKFCGVCGDVARSYHFGGLSCDSCKAFFRRSVQNGNYMRFQCYHSGQCVLSVNNRKSCQYCRMRRCFEIGMEKSWIMSEEERKALMKTRSERKLTKQMVPAAVVAVPPTVKGSVQKNSSTSSLAKIKTNDYIPLVERMTDYMSLLEIKEIESIVTKYAHAYQQVPYRSELRNFDDARPGFQSMEMFGTLVRRFAFYARMMPDFASLPSQDQRTLLKGGVFEMCLLRGALVFDPVNNHWPNTNMSLYKDAPLLKLGVIRQISSSHLFQMHLEFISSMRQLRIDEPTIMLLVLIVLFSQRSFPLLQPSLVEKYQEYYVLLLERYTEWRFGPWRFRTILGKLLNKLSDLRELCETHNPRNVNIGPDEILSIQQQLQHLNFNPFPEFNVIIDDASLTDHQQEQYETAHQPVSVNGGSQLEFDQSSSYPNPQSLDDQIHQLTSVNILSNAATVAGLSQESHLASQKGLTNYSPQVLEFSDTRKSTLNVFSFAHQRQPQQAELENANNPTAHLPNTLLQSQDLSSSYSYSRNENPRNSGPSQPSAPSLQGTSLSSTNPQQEFTTAGPSSEPNTSSGFDMTMSFMRAIQQSVSQVIDQPHFSLEWVQSDNKFKGFDDTEDLGEVLNDLGDVLKDLANCQPSSSTKYDSTARASSSKQNTGIEVRKEKTDNLEKVDKSARVFIQLPNSADMDLTSNVMQEFYFELERYSELCNQ